MRFYANLPGPTTPLGSTSVSCHCWSAVSGISQRQLRHGARLDFSFKSSRLRGPCGRSGMRTSAPCLPGAHG